MLAFSTSVFVLGSITGTDSNAPTTLAQSSWKKWGGRMDDDLKAAFLDIKIHLSEMAYIIATILEEYEDEKQ